MLPNLKIGLVGAGWAARQHCKSLKTIGGADVVAVFDVDAVIRDSLAAELQAVPVRTLDDLLAADIDVVIVSTPSGTHHESVVPALQHNKAVFVEKPVSRGILDAWEIVKTAESSGTICAVGYQWRALDDLLSIDENLQGSVPASIVSQGVGITQARSWFNDDKLSGGLIFERVSHHIDLQRMIAGEVESVSTVRGGVALSGRVNPADTENDILSLILRFQCGSIGVIVVGWAPEEYPPMQFLNLHTTRSSFDLLLDPDFILTDRSGKLGSQKASEHPFQRQMRSFLEATHTRDQSLVHCSARDAAGTVAVALAAAASLDNSGEYQTVPRHPT